MTLSRVSSALPCCVILLGLATPERALGGPQTLVVDLDGGAALDARLPVLEEIFGAGFVPRRVPVLEALDGEHGPWAVHPADALAPCGAPPAAGEELRRSLDAIEGHLMALQYGEALPLLNALEAQLCGASEPIAAELLSRVYFLQGVVLTYADRPGEAEDAFLEAQLLQPTLGWDDDFAPRPQALFEQAAAAVSEQPAVALRVDPTDRPARLLVDGVEIPADREAVELAGPRHLVQVDWGGGLVTRWVRFDAAGEVRLLGPGQLTQQLRSPPPGAAFDRLVASAQRLGHTRVVVLQSAAAPTAWCHDAVAGWQTITWAHHLTRRKAHGSRSAGVVLLAAGGILTVGGGAVGISQYSQGYQLIDEMQQDLGMYRLLIDEYEANRRGAAIGFGVMAAGGVLLAVGLPVMLRGNQVIRTGPQPLQVSFAVDAHQAVVVIRFGRRQRGVCDVCEAR